MTLSAREIDFSYRCGQPVLKKVSLDLQPGTVTALFGPNGCGKSTLLRCFNGALRPQAGEIRLAGKDIRSLTTREIAREVAVVSQSTPGDVPFSALQMVLLGRHAHEEGWTDSANSRRLAMACLQRQGVDRLADRLFCQLSGGEQQRVLFARALAQLGGILLLDEPATHLDIAHQLEIYQLVRRLAEEGITVLMVCHDLLLAPPFADVCVLMTDGQIKAMGKPGEVLNRQNVREAYGAVLDVNWPDRNSIRASFELPEAGSRNGMICHRQKED